jgi:hypothetical protein
MALVVAGAVVCGIAVGAGFASGGSSGARSVVLGSAFGPAYPDIAADGSLGFDAVWTDSDTVIVTAHWSSATGQWTSPRPLSDRVGQSQARVAASASGAAAAIWYVDSSVSPVGTVQASYRPSAARGWQRAVMLGSSSAVIPVSAQVAMDRQGDAFAAWIVRGRGVVMAEHPAGAGAWSSPVTVEPDRRAGGYASLPLALAVSPAGTVALVWERYRSGSTLCCTSAGTNDDLFVAVRPAGSSAWRTRLGLGLDGAASGQDDVDPYWYGPRVAVNARGTVFVAWQWPHAGDYYARVAVIDPSDSWREPRFVALPGPGRNPTVAADDRSFSTVMWDSNRLQAADLSPSALILDVRRVPGGGSYPQLAADGLGDLAGAWGATAVRPGGHRWCPAVPLRAAWEGYNVAIAPDGVGQVVWDNELEAGRVGHGVVQAHTLAPCRAR